MNVHGVVNSIKHKRLVFAKVRKVPRLCTTNRLGDKPRTWNVASWQAEWVMTIGPEVAHSSSEMTVLDVDVGNVLDNFHCLTYRKVANPPHLCTKVAIKGGKWTKTVNELFKAFGSGHYRNIRADMRVCVRVYACLSMCGER